MLEDLKRPSVKHLDLHVLEENWFDSIYKKIQYSISKKKKMVKIDTILHVRDEMIE